MKAALIAAGLGERLRDAGVELPKPLVPIAGKPLLDRVLEAVAAAGIGELACIFNEQADAVEEHCRRAAHGLQLHIVRKSTPSSMESLFSLAPHLDERFLLLTVDAVFGPSVLPDFLRAAAAHPRAAGVLAVTNFVDDEKPLYARLDPRGQITALGAQAAGSATVTAGFYVFEPAIFREMEAARRAGFGALRHFLGHLLDHGYPLAGVGVGKTIDVDRPEDIAAADAFARRGFA